MRRDRQKDALSLCHPVTLSPHQRGFTLLEVLVALVLLALFAVTSYRALDSVLTAERHASAEMARWRQLALAFARIDGDLANAIAGVEPSRDRLRGLYAGVDALGAAYLDFDRLLPEDRDGGLQRVGYRYAAGALTRSVAQDGPVVPGAADAAPILEGLSGLDLLYLDRDGLWRDAWTPTTAKEPLPRAVALNLRFEAGPPLRRVFLLR
jgi:general secretion pathway protein J